MRLQQSKLNAKNVMEWRSACYFETALVKDFFSFFNFTFITRECENKNVPIGLVARNEIKYFFNFVLVTRKRKNRITTGIWNSPVRKPSYALWRH